MKSLAWLLLYFFLKPESQNPNPILEESSSLEVKVQEDNSVRVTLDNQPLYIHVAKDMPSVYDRYHEQDTRLIDHTLKYSMSLDKTLITISLSSIAFLATFSKSANTLTVSSLLVSIIAFLLGTLITILNIMLTKHDLNNSKAENLNWYNLQVSLYSLSVCDLEQIEQKKELEESIKHMEELSCKFSSKTKRNRMIFSCFTGMEIVFLLCAFIFAAIYLYQSFDVKTENKTMTDEAKKPIIIKTNTDSQPAPQRSANPVPISKPMQTGDTHSQPAPTRPAAPVQIPGPAMPTQSQPSTPAKKSE